MKPSSAILFISLLSSANAIAIGLVSRDDETESSLLSREAFPPETVNAASTVPLDNTALDNIATQQQGATLPALKVLAKGKPKKAAKKPKKKAKKPKAAKKAVTKPATTPQTADALNTTNAST